VQPFLQHQAGKKKKVLKIGVGKKKTAFGAPKTNNFMGIDQ